MAGVRGSFGRLKELQASMRKLRSQSEFKRLNRQLGEETVELVHQSFDREREPNGRKWTSLKSRTGRMLRDTNRLFSSITSSSSATGFVVSSNLKYAAVHNFGAVIRPVRAKALAFHVGGRTVFAQKVTIPRRQFIPPSGNLPGTWRKELRRVAVQWTRSVMR